MRMPIGGLRCAVPVAAVLVSGSVVSTALAEPPGRDEFFIEFAPTRAMFGDPERFEGQAWKLNAAIDRPDPEHDRGMAVMMFSGGLSATTDWTVPGFYELNGQRHQLTLSGEPTADGLTIATALRDAGFTVLRYASIREGDPLFAQSPVMAEALKYPGTLALARTAWDELLERSGFAPERVIVLGHSLGAARALQVSEGKAAGGVFLAGAFASLIEGSVRERAREAIGDLDADGDGVVARAEFESTPPPWGSFASIDADGDGELRGWEVLAAIERSFDDTPALPQSDRYAPEETPPSAILIDRTTMPALLLWGELDPLSAYGPRLAWWSAAMQRDNMTTRYFQGLGHALTRERDGLTGPIEPAVLDAIVGWCIARSLPDQPWPMPAD